MQDSLFQLILDLVLVASLLSLTFRHHCWSLWESVSYFVAASLSYCALTIDYSISDVSAEVTCIIIFAKPIRQQVSFKSHQIYWFSCLFTLFEPSYYLYDVECSWPNWNLIGCHFHFIWVGYHFFHFTY